MSLVKFTRNLGLEQSDSNELACIADDLLKGFLPAVHLEQAHGAQDLIHALNPAVSLLGYGHPAPTTSMTIML